MEEVAQSSGKDELEGESRNARCWRRFHRSLEMPLLAKAYFSGFLFFTGIHVFCAAFLELEAVVTYAALLFVLAGYYLVSSSCQRRMMRVAERNGVLRVLSKYHVFSHSILLFKASRLTSDEKRKFRFLCYWQRVSDVVLLIGIVLGMKGVLKAVFLSFPILQYLYYRLVE